MLTLMLAYNIGLLIYLSALWTIEEREDKNNVKNGRFGKRE